MLREVDGNCPRSLHPVSLSHRHDCGVGHTTPTLSGLRQGALTEFTCLCVG